MGTHLRVLPKTYPMNTNMTGFRGFFKNHCVLVLWVKVASASEGLTLMLLVANFANTKSFKGLKCPAGDLVFAEVVHDSAVSLCNNNPYATCCWAIHE